MKYVILKHSSWSKNILVMKHTFPRAQTVCLLCWNLLATCLLERNEHRWPCTRKWDFNYLARLQILIFWTDTYHSYPKKHSDIGSDDKTRQRRFRNDPVIILWLKTPLKGQKMEMIIFIPKYSFSFDKLFLCIISAMDISDFIWITNLTSYGFHRPECKKYHNHRGFKISQVTPVFKEKILEMITRRVGSSFWDFHARKF